MLFFIYKPILQAIHVILFHYFLVKDGGVIPFLLINILNYWININNFEHISDAYEQKPHTYCSKAVSHIHSTGLAKPVQMNESLSPKAIKHFNA